MSSQGLRLAISLLLMLPVTGIMEQMVLLLLSVTGKMEQMELLLLAVTVGSYCSNNLLLFTGHVVDIVRIFIFQNLTVSD